MTEKRDRPREYDVVLGNQAFPTKGAVVLGGIAGVKSRLTSKFVEVRIAAISEALNYGEAGLDLIIQALNDEFWEVRKAAQFLLEERTESKVKEALDRFQQINRYEIFVAYGKKGGKSDVDSLMQALENSQDMATVKLVDYALSLVNNSLGKDRIKHYLFNGTYIQRNYAALYFKRIKGREVLTEAVKLGCIDRVQAFSK